MRYLPCKKRTSVPNWSIVKPFIVHRTTVVKKSRLNRYRWLVSRHAATKERLAKCLRRSIAEERNVYTYMYRTGVTFSFPTCGSFLLDGSFSQRGEIFIVAVSNKNKSDYWNSWKPRRTAASLESLGYPITNPWKPFFCPTTLFRPRLSH